MRPFKHINAETINEALSALEKYKNKARINAGGTDLLGILKDEILPDYPEIIINIKNIPMLDYIKEEKGLLKIGALTKLSELAKSSLIIKKYSAIADAVRTIASAQIRNTATLGGNLCQEVRCWYYRYPRHLGGPILCARKGSGICPAVKGDNRYHAIMGAGKCFAVCPSDLSVVFAAFDAKIVVAGKAGKRKIAITDFFNPLGNALKNEFITGIEIPGISNNPQQNYIKFTLRKPIDFAITSVASVISMNKNVCTDVRIALGGVSHSPVRAFKAEEALKGGLISTEAAMRAAELALVGAKPLNANAYKVQIAKTLVKRAILGQWSDNFLL